MKAFNLKVQITFFIMLLVTALVTSFSLTIARVQKRILHDELSEKVILYGRNLALGYSKTLLHSDPEFELHPHITRILQNNSDVVEIVVVDSKGIIKGHSDLRKIDTSYTLGSQFIQSSSAEMLENGELLCENNKILEVRIPVKDQDNVIGYVFLEYSKNRMIKALSDTNDRIIRTGIAALVFGSLVSLFLAHHISRPVKKLTEGAELIGKGNLDTRIEVRSVQEVQTLADTFNRMASSLQESRKLMREKERFDMELEIAKSIQDSLLPSRIPEFDDAELGAYYNPAELVGGDYFDLIPVNERKLMLVVGDVSGKGVPGLLIMAMARGMVRDLANRRENPEKLLRHLNLMLKKDTKENFFLTMFCGILDTDDGTFTFASAAHMPLFYYRSRDRKVEAIKTKAKPLGVFSDETFSLGLEEVTIRMEPGDLILQYTDGLSELRNENGEELGLERIRCVVETEARGGAKKILSALMTEAERFRGSMEQRDDLTMLAFSLRAADAVKGHDEAINGKETRESVLTG